MSLKDLTPEEIMSMDDSEFDKLDYTTTHVPQEEPEEVETEVEEPTVTEPEELPPTEYEPSEEEEDEEVISVLEMDDEEFEKLGEESPKESVKEEPSDKPKVPTIEELKAKVEQANKFKEENDKYLKNKDIIDALEVNNLLDKKSLNTLINVKKGSKEAIVDLLKELNISPKDLLAVKKEAQEAIENAGGASEDEDDFDSWFNNITGKTDEEKPKEKEEEKPAEENTAEQQAQVDHFEALARQKVGETARQVITEYGQDTLNYVDSFIDVASYEEIKKDPTIIRDFAEQHKSGVMVMINDRIKEMDERGYFPQGFPYINKYKLAGDALIKEAQFVKPIDRKVGSGKSTKVDNIEHAQTINTSTGASKSGNITAIDILNMSDEEFAKFDK